MVPTPIISSSSQLSLTALAQQQQLVNERAESQKGLRTDSDEPSPYSEYPAVHDGSSQRRLYPKDLSVDQGSTADRRPR